MIISCLFPQLTFFCWILKIDETVVILPNFWRVVIIALNFSAGMTGVVDYKNYDDMKYAVRWFLC